MAHVHCHKAKDWWVPNKTKLGNGTLSLKTREKAAIR